MKTIYRVEHDGVVGVIESPDEINSTRPLAEQVIVKIGVIPDAPRLDTEDFEPRARLVVLELLSYLHDEAELSVVRSRTPLEIAEQVTAPILKTPHSMRMRGCPSLIRLLPTRP